MPETLQILETQEKKAPIKERSGSLLIGLPKEKVSVEKRIALTPDAVGILCRNGHEVCIEKDAGLNAGFTTEAYSQAGAKIALSHEEVFSADIVLKIESPTEKEIELMKTGATLISAIQFTRKDKTYFDTLIKKRITAIAFEYMEDKVGNLPVIRAMSEIAGSTAIMIGYELLSQSKGKLLGGIAGVPPTSVVILGAGTVAEFAARTAIGLGAEVKIFDTHLYKLQRIRYSLGQHVYTSIIDSDNLGKALSTADVLVAAMRPEKGLTPLLVTEEMVEAMEDKSVIVDIAIDQGGCIETSRLTTHEEPTYVKHGIIHYAVPNIASKVANTASQSLSNIFTPLLLKTGNLGGIEEMILSNPWFLKGVYAFKGNITNQLIAKKFDLRHRDLRLLLAARI